MPRGIYPRKSLQERFEEKVIKHENGCWEWLGRKDKNGYGMMCNHLAHHISYELYVDSIPKNYQLNHICQNKCSNPNHVYLGNQKENSQDIKRKSIDYDKVLELHQQGLSYAEVGRQLGDYSGPYIGRIVNGKQRGKNRWEILIKQNIYDQQQGICNGCKEYIEWEFARLDHIIPKSKSGSNEEDNLQILCISCNSIKGNRSMEYLFERLENKNKTKKYKESVSLTDNQIKKLKQQYQTGEWKQIDLANKYKLHPSTVSLIINNKIRK